MPTRRARTPNSPILRHTLLTAAPPRHRGRPPAVLVTGHTVRPECRRDAAATALDTARPLRPPARPQPMTQRVRIESAYTAELPSFPKNGPCFRRRRRNLAFAPPPARRNDNGRAHL